MENLTFIERRIRESLIDIITVGDIIIRIRSYGRNGYEAVKDKVVYIDDKFITLYSNCVNMNLTFAKSQISCSSKKSVLYLDPLKVVKDYKIKNKNEDL